MKAFLAILIATALVVLLPRNTLAIYDPGSVPNNKVGIHIFNENDLEDASALVNASGGDWGYVTFVITEKERDCDRWQKVLDRMRGLHLIPIMRLATKADGGIWKKPEEEEIANWVDFLNSLNWVVKNRYVVIGNEPNLDNEWGGKADAAAYATYLKSFSVKLKSASDDFFVLPAGMAPDKNEFAFIRLMLKTEPDILNHIDGWTSHSYPTASIDLYKDELKLLGKSFPVFITETGWSGKRFTEEEIGVKLISAYRNTWNDPKVIAVTPFILNYPQEPFAEFSWKKNDGSFYKFYSSIKDMEKIRGEPVQIESGQILAAFIQPVILHGLDFVGTILARNTGQSIWSPDSVSVGSGQSDLIVRSVSFNEIEPMRFGLIIFKAAATENTGVYSSTLFLTGTKQNKVTNGFSVKSVATKLDKMQVEAIFAKMGGYFRNLVNKGP
ncbi:MAG: hypothetical protein UX13_C0022G0006 [Candidatus Woesebacteria bacterium GW2011_GWB1_45_5]|uniref:Asl1-like glycosyl hydrolase catalytic domain-containing protein n=1 Tax=Candidatus Woesebacteria bacterium GW2011_GWB1_45_5 TaxID=1618581 RepID=A0A0G1QN02_9BACT|nr:MAG: hypothetical protein UX13_C0022G0006 [Candidatus Woesebacteria bacterium GW2011_GWB1_45_5]